MTGIVIQQKVPSVEMFITLSIRVYLLHKNVVRNTEEGCCLIFVV